MFFAVHQGLTFHVVVAEGTELQTLILARSKLSFTLAGKGGAFTNILFLQCPVLLTYTPSIPRAIKVQFS